mmetsp:Transcript_16525/g.39526  ORF Transcript_16525/g.39526 Transcript_16525/m.39526 type:complete len:337 (+) Transcript_16525:2254-3264(+)
MHTLRPAQHVRRTHGLARAGVRLVDAPVVHRGVEAVSAVQAAGRARGGRGGRGAQAAVHVRLGVVALEQDPAVPRQPQEEALRRRARTDPRLRQDRHRLLSDCVELRHHVFRAVAAGGHAHLAVRLHPQGGRVRSAGCQLPGLQSVLPHDPHHLRAVPALHRLPLRYPVPHPRASETDLLPSLQAGPRSSDADLDVLSLRHVPLPLVCCCPGLLQLPASRLGELLCPRHVGAVPVRPQDRQHLHLVHHRHGALPHWGPVPHPLCAALVPHPGHGAQKGRRRPAPRPDRRLQASLGPRRHPARRPSAPGQHLCQQHPARHAPRLQGREARQDLGRPR